MSMPSKGDSALELVHCDSAATHLSTAVAMSTYSPIKFHVIGFWFVHWFRSRVFCAAAQPWFSCTLRVQQLTLWLYSDWDHPEYRPAPATLAVHIAAFHDQVSNWNIAMSVPASVLVVFHALVCLFLTFLIVFAVLS